MSLQLKLNLMISILLLMLLSISAVFVVKNASEDVRAEVTSTANLALHLLDAEILHYTSDYSWVNPAIDEKKPIFRLQSLDNIRHLKIDFYDVYGRLRETNRQQIHESEEDAPPAWFNKAMGLTEGPIQKQVRDIMVHGRYVGKLVVTPDPSYEIAEIWNDTIGLLGLVAIFFVLVNLIVYFAVKYTFKPVNRILEGLTQMEKGYFNDRLPVFKQVELQAIGHKFNVMANTLQQSTLNNHRLTQQIIRLQEDERKSLARDIHDEIGQYLTAIHVDASAILSGTKLVQAKESAKAISAITRQMMDIVHEILQRLRPRTLDELGLGLALGELIHHWRQRHRQINLTHKIPNDLGLLDESVSITAYRVVQECLTNIAKHANANNVTIIVKQQTDTITLTIQDDGIGFDTSLATHGYGLAGMRERILGLMGEINIVSSKNVGTLIKIKLFKQLVTKGVQ